MTTIGSLDTLLRKGYAQVTLDEAGAAALEALMRAAGEFFALPLESKTLYSELAWTPRRRAASSGQSPPWEMPTAGSGTVANPVSARPSIRGGSPGGSPGGPGAREPRVAPGSERSERTAWGLGLDGYRAYGSEFSVDDRLGDAAPRQRDQNEVFVYWADDPLRLPRRSAFVGALRGYWKVAAGITADLLGQLAEHYRYFSYEIDVDPYSYIGINSYASQPQPEFLQTTHEDAHLWTLVFATEPGLEIEIDGQMRPWQGGPGEGIIMTGSLLTAMTGREVPPLHHRVRNHHQRRLAAGFFVNLPFNDYVPPYVENDTNRFTDLAALSVRNCGLFGKPRPAVSWRRGH